MKALVTGGGGFLGGAIVHALVGRGDTVSSFSRGRYPALDELGVEQHRGDLGDREAVAAAVRGADVVFHVAAKAGVWGPRRDYLRANVDGTKHVLDACRRHGVGRLVHTSSPSVTFDGRDQEGVDESAPYPSRFLAAYPETKAIAERAVLAANDGAFATVALRPHLVWGPGDNHLVPRVLEKARAGRLRRFRGPDKPVDSVYIDNAADAHVRAADRLAPAAACAGKAYFISNDQPLPMWTLIDRILAAGGEAPVRRTIAPGLAYLAGALLETIYAALRKKTEPPMTRFVARQLATAHWFDLTAAKRDLGYAPAVSIDEGMKRLAAWLGAT